MESIRILKEIILETVQDNLNNKKLLKSVRKEFIQKRLNISVPNLLWSDNLDEDNVDKNELIAITKAMYNELGDDKFKLTTYFSEGEIFEYENNINIQDKRVDYVLFKNVKKIDSMNYLGVINGEQALEMRKNTLYAYYKQFQRAPKLVKTSSGRIIKKIDINIKNVKDMMQEFKSGTMTPTSIHLAILVKNENGLNENFKFKTMYEDIGDMWIKPDFDVMSSTYLPLICVDGFHRLSAMVSAVEEMKLDKKNINCQLGCFIHIFNDEASVRKFIIDTFKRCDTDLDYLNSINPTDENEFISEFINKSRWLSGHVASTKQEMKIETNYVDQKTLIETFKSTDIDINDSVQSAISRENVGRIIDDLLDYVFKELYSENMGAFKESLFLNNNIFKLYIKFAARLRNKEYKVKIGKLVNYINNNYDKIKSELDNRNVGMEVIDGVLREVINNE